MVDVGLGLKVIKGTLDSYELGYYEYCEVLRFVVVCVSISYEKGEGVTEELITGACQDGLDFIKKYPNKAHYQ